MLCVPGTETFERSSPASLSCVCSGEARLLPTLTGGRGYRHYRARENAFQIHSREPEHRIRIYELI